MRGFIACCALVFSSSELVGSKTSLEEVYGPVKFTMEMDGWAERVTMKDSKLGQDYFDVRTPGNCVFPLEIVILQDATASFQDDFKSMTETQIPEMLRALEATHPHTKYSVVSFRDKPVETLGNASDYCERFDLPLVSDQDQLLEAYKKMVSTGGADPAENQFGALVAAAQSDEIGWSSAEYAATKLIVLSTDAYPHFDLDGLNNYGMKNFTGKYDQANPETQCLEEYYPSPAQVMKSLVTRQAYLAQLVFDGDWQNGLVRKSWEWFNAYIKQTPEFLEPLANDASNFWEKLSVVIKAIEEAECKPLTTTTTTAPLTTAATTTANPTTSAPPCQCQKETECKCKPAVVIKLKERPTNLRLVVEN